MAGLSEVVLDRSFPVITKMSEGIYVGDKKRVVEISGPFASATANKVFFAYSYALFCAVAFFSLAIAFAANKILVPNAVSFLFASAIALHPFSTLTAATVALAVLYMGTPV